MTHHLKYRMSVTTAAVFLLFFVSMVHCGGLIIFGDMARNIIFNSRKDAILLFYSDQTQRQSKAVFSNYGAQRDGQLLFSPVGSANPEYSSLAEEIGLKLREEPVMVIVKLGFQKFASPQGTPITADGIQEFIKAVDDGEVPLLMKSQPIPEHDGRALKTLVCDYFRETVHNDSRQYLILFYIPSNSKCQALRPIFESIAESISHNPNIVLAQFDRSKNDVPDLIVEEYPKLIWYRKDKKAPHLQLDGVENTKGILRYIKSNTEYKWLQPLSKQEQKKKSGEETVTLDEEL